MRILTFRKGINMKIAILEDNIFFQQKIISLLNLGSDLVHVYSDIDSYNLSPSLTVEKVKSARKPLFKV
jgi:hypothetical protein